MEIKTSLQIKKDCIRDTNDQVLWSPVEELTKRLKHIYKKGLQGDIHPCVLIAELIKELEADK